MGTLAVTEELHAKQQEAARKGAERAARKAPQDAAADAKGKPGNQRPKRVRPPGAVVLQVDPQSAAERAGLKPGDLVTELGGMPVRDAADLHVRLALLRIGEVAELAISRPGGTLTVRAETAAAHLDAARRCAEGAKVAPMVRR
jgi:S1-C subfamily serine protease